jgi:type VI secretion system protein VasD
MPLPRRALLTAATLLALPGCGLFGGDEPPPPPPPLAPPPPPPPTIVSLTLEAAPDVNAGLDGTGRPLQVRLLKLATANELMEADFFALDGDPAAALGKALVGEERLTLGPGQVVVWQRQLEEGVRFVGIVAAYRDVGASQWRAFAETPRNQTTLLLAKFGANGVKLGPAGL